MRIVMVSPAGALVSVKAADRAAFERQGYRMGQRDGPDAGGATPPVSPQAQEADSAPPESAPAAGDTEDAPDEESKPAVSYPRSRGRNTKPRA